MADDETMFLRCFEYVCPLFPRCERAVGGCAVDDFFEDETLSQEQCLDRNDKPFFIEKG